MTTSDVFIQNRHCVVREDFLLQMGRPSHFQIPLFSKRKVVTSTSRVSGAVLTAGLKSPSRKQVKDSAVKVKDPGIILIQLNPAVESENKLLVWDISQAESVGLSLCQMTPS